ncbi:hypothetical protein NC653_018701 [Populus alba x Populus x berolinensis]|uniref:Uncharacterized protein n=1 Tax=Populus alba x Populus x berolinensis TaxID=444605 RepID=A0AAD6QGZ4_9ROSI|nr:hypothetical protein NC653_018701 [Populus alba x Populus x berolinensis]
MGENLRILARYDRQYDFRVGLVRDGMPYRGSFVVFSNFAFEISKIKPPPPPINSSPRPFPLTAASFSPVNKLGLFSDDHSLNLERNCRLCEVAKLLLLPDLLQSIASIKADYIAQVDERTQFGKEIGIIVPVSDS